MKNIEVVFNKKQKCNWRGIENMNYEELDEIIVKSQDELDAIPLDFNRIWNV